MKEKREKYQLLRQRAEIIIQKGSKDKYFDTNGATTYDLNALIHELEVHKIELEMQNNALRDTQEALETTRKNYYDLFDFAPIGYMTLDKEGIIHQVNLTMVNMLETNRCELTGENFHHFVQTDERDKLYLLLKKVFTTSEIQQTKLLLHPPSGQNIPALIRSQKYDHEKENVCRMVICDLRPYP